MKNKDILSDNRIIFLCFFAFISFVISVFLIIHNGINGVDAYYYWVNSAYFSRGYNLEWVKQTEFVLDGIGDMQGVGVLPYGRVLHNFLFPGFLSYKIAYLYNWILIFFITTLLLINIYKWISYKGFFEGKASRAIVALCFVMIPWLWPGYLRAGNPGGLIALMAILAAFYIDENENVAALLIAFSLIKPQIGGIFLISLFLIKKYRLVAKTVGIIAISELIHLIYTGIMNHVRGIYWPIGINSLVSIFEGYAGKDAEKERGITWHLYYGIFNLLKDVGVPVIIVLLLSMVAGIMFTFILIRYVKNNSEMYNDYVVIFAIASLASLIWFYKSECDNIVLIMCNMPIMYYLRDKKLSAKNMIAAGSFLVGLNWLVGRYLLRFAVPVASYPVGILIDQILQIVLFVMIIILCVKNKSIDVKDGE